MGFILALALLALILAAAFVIQMLSFAVTAFIIGFKLCVAGLVGYLVWRCFKAIFSSGRRS